jgi:hypothetical protein
MQGYLENDIQIPMAREAGPPDHHENKVDWDQ